LNKPADKPAKASPQPDDTKTRKRKPTGGIECKLGLLLGLGGLIGSRLGQLWIAFDVFSQFTLQFIVVTLAFVIGLLMPRAKLLAAFLVIIIGIIAIGVWPHAASQRPFTSGTVEAGEKVLRVANFNTWYDNQQVSAVEAEINRLDADVIALEEVGLNKKPALEALKARYPHQATCFTIDFCNLVILSKWPIAATEAKVSWEGPPYLLARLGPEAGSLTVIAAHTIRFPHSRAQFRQVTALAAMIEGMAGHKLLMGDFNATPFSRIIETIEARASLNRLTYLPSWPSRVGLPQIAIDHIFVSRATRLVESQTIGNSAGSDHHPVTVKIAIPAAQ
jgi:endonuclease/exonuclease/phosphatase (EEP) superfamily protein YafD